MLSAGQKAYFETFGFLVLRGLLAPDEMEVIGREADDVLAEGRGDGPLTATSVRW